MAEIRPGEKKTSRPLVTAALMLGMFLAAMEATIVATAMPSIVASLSGFALFSWVFSAFLLAQAALIPVYGKLADLYGRKPVYLFGTSLFLLGALLSAQARTMPQLIAFRAVQGLGAASILPITQTLIGDLYSLEERARIQGLLGSVWGISSVAGPAAGGLIVQYLSWPWIFYLNLPLGLVSLAGVYFFLHEQVRRRPSRIDLAGSFFLTVSITLLVSDLIQVGTAWPWFSLPGLLLLTLSLLSGLLFFYQEKRSSEPVLPLWLFTNRVISTSNAAVLTAGALTVGMSTFIPIFAQGVLGASPLAAGMVLGVMSLGWPLASSFTGYLLLAWGCRFTAVAGTLFTMASALLLGMLGPGSSLPLALAGTFLMGIGMGLSSTTYLVSIQEAVAWQQRGVATSSNSLLRLLGGVGGVAVMSNLLNNSLHEGLSHIPWLAAPVLKGEARLNLVNLLLDPAARTSLAPHDLFLLRTVLSASLHKVFLAFLVVSILGFLVVWALPAKVQRPAS